HSISNVEGGFRLETSRGAMAARTVVLATGGRSLPKTGSDGGGYGLATALGHSLVPQTPALAPLVLDGSFHASLSGIAGDVELTALVAGEKPVRIRGPMLWTHIGVSGPAAMDMSRVWHRAVLNKAAVELRVNFLPGETFESVDGRLAQMTDQQSQASPSN